MQLAKHAEFVHELQYLWEKEFTVAIVLFLAVTIRNPLWEQPKCLKIQTLHLNGKSANPAKHSLCQCWSLCSEISIKKNEIMKGEESLLLKLHAMKTSGEVEETSQDWREISNVLYLEAVPRNVDLWNKINMI
jgi:hypothetical protein